MPASSSEQNWIRPTLLLHLQTARAEAEGRSATEREVRRERWGTKAGFLNHWILSLSINAALENGVPYEDVSQAWIAWTPSGNRTSDLKRTALLVGKLKPRFNREYSTSAAKLTVIERGLLNNQLAPDKTTGIEGRYQWNAYKLRLGVYAGEKDEAFAPLDPDATLLLSKLTYEVNATTDLELDLLYTSGALEVLQEVRSALALSGSWAPPSHTIQAQLLLAEGQGDAPDLGGIMLYTDLLLQPDTRLVARYEGSRSLSSAPGLRLRRRYERAVAPETGDRGKRYQALYLGLHRRLLADPNLHLLLGVEAFRMSDQDVSGITAATALRLAF